MTENWKPVSGYEGIYEVSDQGRVRSLDRVVALRGLLTRKAPGRVLSPSPNNQGYPTLTLCRDAQGQNVKLHTLVATHFLGARPAGMEARHLNGNPLDCRAANLAWGTHGENMKDQVRHGTNHHRNKTHCPQGHEYDGANTRLGSDGKRHCRACARQSSKAYRDRKVLTRLGGAA